MLQRWWKRLFGEKPGERSFALDEDLGDLLRELARQENCAEGEMAGRLLRTALHDAGQRRSAWEPWKNLSPREQDVAALICLGYTTRQIAARLGLSPETIKSHVRSILIKFDLPSRQALRAHFSGWDFSAWDKERGG